MLRTSIDLMKERWQRERSKRYPVQTITDADDIDDVSLQANTPTQDETLLHNLERAAAGIGLHVNADKTEYMCFNQSGVISTQKGGLLKLVVEFTYIGSSVSSNETDVNTWLAKAWAASIGYQSYGSQTWPIKWNAVFSQQRSCRYYYMDEVHGR